MNDLMLFLGQCIFLGFLLFLIFAMIIFCFTLTANALIGRKLFKREVKYERMIDENE